MYDFFLKNTKKFFIEKKIQFFHARNITYKNLIFKFSIELRDDATRRSIYSAYYVYIQCRYATFSRCLIYFRAVSLPRTITTNGSNASI